MTAVSIDHRPPSVRTRLAGTPRTVFGSGRRGHPHAHPDRSVPSVYAVRPRSGVRACRLSEAAVAPATTWRLTDRGVAVVLVVGLMIMVAALTVVGLTAVQVTGPDYRHGASTLAQSR